VRRKRLAAGLSPIRLWRVNRRGGGGSPDRGNKDDATVTKDRKIDLGAMRIGVLMNSASGACDLNAAHELQALLADAGLAERKLWCIGPDEMGAALAELRTEPLDALIVLGGDGTIRAAAEIGSERGLTLLPLPGGTMNMLPKALFGARPWQAALRDTLADPVLQAVSGGKVGAHAFFVTAIFGNASLLAKVREAVRANDFAAAFDRGQQALQLAFTTRLDYRYGERSGQAEMVSVLCPMTSTAMDNEEPALEVAIVDPDGPLGALQLAFAGLVSQWRQDASVETGKATQVTLTAETPIPALLDGEWIELTTDETIDFTPAAFYALRPR
jgi:diacylglycerol kinase family enzyme